MPVAPVLMVGTAQKSSSDSIRIAADAGNDPVLIALLTDSEGNYVPTNVGITGFTVTTSGLGAPTISGVQLDYPYVISARVSGGTTGTYPLVYTATLADSDASIIARTGVINIY